MTKRLLIVTSDRSGLFGTSTPAEEQFRKFPYSLGAIRYNLEQIGWTTCYSSLSTSGNVLTLAKLIDTFKPSIIYTYGGTVSLHPLICRKLLCRHKTFKVIHGWDDRYGEVWDDYLGKIPGLLMHWMEKRIIKNSDAVVTLSYYHQACALKWGVKCHYIPNGADIPSIDPTQNKITLDGKFNLVYTGDMARWKRTWEICEAMRSVPKDIKLYLTGSHYPYLDPYMSENCIYLGYVDKQVQLNVMAQADAFVVTADQDCNAKLQEYLRFKKPILGYDGRLNHFFKNGRNALLTKDYPSAIQKLASDPILCSTLSMNAEKDIPVYSWLEIAKQFNDFFCENIQAMRNT
jgi:glycosyltransferase involved in cell wall biosynthesis